MFELITIALLQFSILTGQSTTSSSGSYDITTPTSQTNDIGNGGWGHDKTGDDAPAIGNGGWGHD